MNENKRYLISIDGGGTKTDLCVYDCLADSSHTLTCGGGNYKTHGIETVRERIGQGLREALPDAEDIPSAVRFLVMGISGCDSARDVEIYTDMMRSLGFAPEQMLICNDSEMLFRSVADAPGICVVAGTGTIALSFETNGKVCRAGGWGAPISDEGSGYWIGSVMIRCYLEWIDGIGRDAPFFTRLTAVSPNGDPEEAAAILADLHPAQTAEWAKTILEAAEEDIFSENIVKTAAGKTALLAASVYRKSKFQKETGICIVESGSLFKNELYENEFRSSLKRLIPADNCHILRSDGIPAEDGIRLAKKLAAAGKNNGNNSIG